MKTIIIYKGRYGATKQYAEWLSEALQCSCFSAENVHDNLAHFDLVILGTSVYIGELQISKWLKKNQHQLINKKIVLFLVSGTPPDEKEKLNSYLQSGLPQQLINNTTVFFLPGRLIIEKLSWFDRFLLRMGARLSNDAKTKKAMLTNYNHVEKHHLNELIGCIEDMKRRDAELIF